MELTEKRYGKTLVLGTDADSLDGHSAHRFLSFTLSKIPENERCWLDLETITHIDTRGMRALSKIYRYAKVAQSKVGLCNLDSRILKKLQYLGFDDLFVLEQSFPDVFTLPQRPDLEAA